MAAQFPPGLLNPGPSSAAAGAAAAAGWCGRVLGVECPTRRELIFNLFFTSYGVWMLLPLSVLLLLLYRLVGPPEVDEREEELRQQWADHRQRFKSGAKRSSLRGVIKSSYLKELSGNRVSGSGSGVAAGGDGGGDGTLAASAAAVAESNNGNNSNDDGGKGCRVAASHGSALSSSTPSQQQQQQQQQQGSSSSSSSSSENAPPTAAAAAAAADGVPRLPPPRETVYVVTTPGPTRVTIVGDRGRGNAGSSSVLSSGSSSNTSSSSSSSNTTRTGGDGDAKSAAAVGGGGGCAATSTSRKQLSVLTLHAAGHNHRTCLGALERVVAKDEELGGSGGGGGVVFYHVDTPGHEEEAQDIETKALSLEAQASQLLEVAIQLGLNWFVGLGVGAGANVLLRFACDNPDRVAGLILANGSAEEAGRRERNLWLSPRFRLSWEKDMKAARESLVPLSFPPYSSLGNRYRAGLGTMHSGNVLKYVDASLCRDDIPVSRLQAINDVWTLLLCGTEAPGSSSRAGFLTSLVAGVDAEEASRSLLDKIRRAAAAAAGGGWGQASKATLVTLDGGGVGGGLLEAKPLEVLAAMKLFLNKCF